MSLLATPPSTPRHRLPGSLVALGLAALILVLFVVNIRSLCCLQQADRNRLQQRLRDYGQSVRYFLSERENDMRMLAGSMPVMQYFHQLQSGRSEDGNRNAIKAILLQFEQDNAVAQGASIYASLSLRSADGEELMTLNRGGKTTVRDTPLVTVDGAKAAGPGIPEAEAMMTFSHPVVIDDQVAGFVLARVQYATMVKTLFDIIPGGVLMADPYGAVQHSPPEYGSSERRLQHLVGARLAPAGNDDGLFDPISSQVPSVRGGDQRLFVDVPGHDLVLYLPETDGFAKPFRYQWFFSISLLLLFLGAIVSLGFMHLPLPGRKPLREPLRPEDCQQKSVLEQKKTLELVLEGAQLGTWNWDIANGTVEFNDRFFTMLGYEPGELPSNIDTWKQLLHPEDGKFVLPVLEAHLCGITSDYATEHRLRHKDGHWVWVLDTGRVMLRDEQGNPQRAFGVHLDISERQESTRLLTKARDEADAIIRNFLDTLIVVNTDLEVVRVNQATCQLLGYQENELLGRPVVELFLSPGERVTEAFGFYRLPEARPPEADGLLSDITWAMMRASEELRNVELCYRRKDGTRLPMSFNINLLRDEDGVVTGCIAGGKDVSGLRQAIDTIGSQKRYIEVLFDIVSVGMVALSPEKEVVRSNRAFRMMMEHWSQRLSLTMAECSQQMIEGLLRAQTEDGAFTCTLGQEPAMGHFRCRATQISSLHGIAAVLTVEDITSEVAAEEAKKLLAAVIEQTEDGVIVTETDGIIRYVNSATMKITGFLAEELVGRMPSIFTDNLVEPKILADMRRTLEAGESWSGHLRSRRKDGAVLEEEATVSPIRNDQGQTTHYVAIWRDITELIELQRQLSQARKMESIGQLAAGIAHEINTPMQYVQNNVTFFEQSFDGLQALLTLLSQCPQDRLSETVPAQLETVDLEFLLEEIPASISETLQGINRVVKIVAAMKEFSHPGGPEKVATDINHSLESTLIVCRNEWKYSTELVTDLAEDLPTVPCFVDQLHQVLVNLVINAVHAIQEQKKAVPETAGRITVGTRAEDGWVEIRIGDNGSGIPEAIRSRIFEPFFTTKEIGKGTGQGLALVYDVIVNKHGGKVDFTTKAGTGTTFILRLPTGNADQNTLV